MVLWGGERFVAVVQNSNTAIESAISSSRCLLAPNLNNMLSAIVGQCELLSEHKEMTPELTQHVMKITRLVMLMAETINGDECRLIAMANSRAVKPEAVSDC